MALIVVPHRIHESGLELLRAARHEVRVLDSGDATPVTALREAEAILVRTLRLTPEVLASCPRLRVVAKHGAGVDNIALDAARERGIRVVNAPAANSATVAEWTLGALVALARDFRGGLAALQSGQWNVREELQTCDLSQKTLGVIGLGRIGTQVARRAIGGLEMRVLAFDPFRLALPDELRNLDTRLCASREDVLRESDFVALHIPGGEANRGAFGAPQIAQMKRGSFLLNACRGEVLDETALLAALQSGHLRGAALDVFEAEPPAPDHPLLAHPRVLATPHNAALTREAAQRMSHDAAQGIVEVLAGREPTWPVV